MISLDKLAKLISCLNLTGGHFGQSSVMPVNFTIVFHIPCHLKQGITKKNL